VSGVIVLSAAVMLGVMGLGITGLVTGRIWGRGFSGSARFSGRMIDRHEEPAWFWFHVFWYFLLPVLFGVGMVFGHMSG